MAPSNSTGGNPVASSTSMAGSPQLNLDTQLPHGVPAKRRHNSEEKGSLETPPKLRKKVSNSQASKLPNEINTLPVGGVQVTEDGKAKVPSKQGSDNQHRGKKKLAAKKAELLLKEHDQAAGNETDPPTACGTKMSITPHQIVETLPALQPPLASRPVTRSASAKPQPATKSASGREKLRKKLPMNVSASGNVQPMRTPSPPSPSEIRREGVAEENQVMNKWPLIFEELIELGKEFDHVGEAILREGLTVSGAAGMQGLVQQWTELKLAESTTLLKRAELTISVVKVALDAFRAI